MSRSPAREKADTTDPARDGTISRLETSFLPDGTYQFRDQLNIEGKVTTTVVTCAGWLLELYELTAGDVYFLRGKTEIRAHGKRFGVFYPPDTLVRPCFRNARAELLGLAGTARLGQGVSAVPFIFETPLLLKVESVWEILEAAQNCQFVDANPNASALSIKARQLIIDEHTGNSSIARIAARLGVSNAHLSRQFRRDYGMSPREYLHQLRMADAPLELARGGAITDISFDSGYGDLGRFYKQFRKATGTSPGICRGMVAPGGRR
jgi:AraC-like DNA-binding protein